MMCLPANALNSGANQSIPIILSLGENDRSCVTNEIVEEPSQMPSPQVVPKRVTRSSTSSRRKYSIRHVVQHTYHDHCPGHTNLAQSCDVGSGETKADASEGEAKQRNIAPRGGVATPFPIKLHLMLSRAKIESFDHIVSWQPHGRCFKVHKPNIFVANVMPRWFNQSKLTSFQRQLNLYGFFRLTTGNDRGAYYHELFLRGHSQLSKHMVRTCIKGTGVKPSASPLTEPNFYTMLPCLEDCTIDQQNQIAEHPAYQPSTDNSLTDVNMNFWMFPLDFDETCSLTTDPHQLTRPTEQVVESLVPAPKSSDSVAKEADTSSNSDCQAFQCCTVPSLSSTTEVNDSDEDDDEMLFEGHRFYRVHAATRV